MATATETKTVAGDLHKDKALILDFAWSMKKAGLMEATIKNRTRGLKRLSSMGADLTNPNTVETILATEQFTKSVKLELVRGYYAFCQSLNIKWKKPKVHYERPDPFIPTETEIDILIAGCGKRTATLLQVLKDTGARISEGVKTRWKDINDKNMTIGINTPSKGSRSRTIKVSEKTIAMVKAMPNKYDPYIFSPNVEALRSSFYLSREKLARRLQEPRLRQIHFHTLRHWRAIKEYRRTLCMKTVQQMLGHKSILNTDIYTRFITFENLEWIVKRPRTAREEDELIENDFQFVRYDDAEGCPIYRKRK